MFVFALLLKLTLYSEAIFIENMKSLRETGILNVHTAPKSKIVNLKSKMKKSIVDGRWSMAALPSMNEINELFAILRSLRE